MSILLNTYQTLANAQVLSRPTNVPLEELPWAELCALLHENIEALVSNFSKANQRISHLEYICKHKTDTMNDLQQNQEEALEKMSEQLKAQERWWQKEKQYLEQQYSNVLAEFHARSQECEETAQKMRQKLYGLEQLSDKLAQENESLKNSLLDAFKARSSLLAACALLSGALCSLYGRLCATSRQRDILQERVNQHQLLNHKIVSLLYALPAVVERNQDEGRLRQRRAKNLVYVFRRAVIAVLAANRLRALARYSCTFFIWTDGCRGSSGIQVCLGESRGRHPVTRFGEEGVDCIEAVNWLSSSNLYTAIVSSISELEGVLSNQDSELWLSSNSLIGTARNCFAKLMDNLSVLMETVQGNARGCRAYLERDSLIERLARGLQRVNAQALEAGFHDRLPSTRNIATLQQEIFEFSRRLHAAEVESRSLHLQLAECRWAFNEMQKDAEKAKAHRLQTQLSEAQQRINQDNIHEELDNALQREHEAQLLLQVQQQGIQELSNRLELHSCTNKDRSQVSNVPLMSLSNATEELRRRDQVLDHQNRLLKDTEQDQQRLQETLQEAERAIQQGAIDEELIINHIKAVEAALNEVRDEAVASDAAAAAPLPSLKTLSEEAMRDRPEARSFQALSPDIEVEIVPPIGFKWFLARLPARLLLMELAELTQSTEERCRPSEPCTPILEGTQSSPRRLADPGHCQALLPNIHVGIVPPVASSGFWPTREGLFRRRRLRNRHALRRDDAARANPAPCLERPQFSPRHPADPGPCQALSPDIQGVSHRQRSRNRRGLGRNEANRVNPACPVWKGLSLHLIDRRILGLGEPQDNPKNSGRKSRWMQEAPLQLPPTPGQPLTQSWRTESLQAAELPGQAVGPPGEATGAVGVARGRQHLLRRALTSAAEAQSQKAAESTREAAGRPGGVVDCCCLATSAQSREAAFLRSQMQAGKPAEPRPERPQALPEGRPREGPRGEAPARAGRVGAVLAALRGAEPPTLIPPESNGRGEKRLRLSMLRRRVEESPIVTVVKRVFRMKKRREC
ncbi:coiled-coil domain-containing protein 171-like [Molothrus aeneus]|uniref:coiled-coil domain-containing protein 171-like n=1 Tax=Molothrus aeneus TaxID=84833 RepID=UPI0034588A3A